MSRMLGICSILMGLLFASLASVSVAIATPSPVRISEFPLGVGAFYPSTITAGPAGDIWFVLGSGIPGRTISNQSITFGIDRIDSQGQTTAFPLSGRSAPESMTFGSDGNIWFGEGQKVSRVTPTGQITTFAVPANVNGPIASGAEGSLWLTGNGRPGIQYGGPTDRVIRMNTSGEIIASFTLSRSESGLNSITLDRQGGVWFAETFGNAIGSITPEGQIREFSLPSPKSYPSGITVGPEGNLWFAETLGSKPAIGRITPSGRFTHFPLIPGRDQPQQLVAGKDGRLWFIDGPAQIGRITPGGRVTRIKLPNPASDLTGIVAGPKGTVWYSAHGEPPVEGGGGTQLAHILNDPGIIGRIIPGPLTVRIATGDVKAVHRRARVSLACGGGHASSVCRGRVRVSIAQPQGRAITLARGRYALPVDLRRRVNVSLTDRAVRLLGSHRRLRASVSIVPAEGTSGQAKKIILHR